MKPTIKPIKDHPLTAVFPRMTGLAFDRLRADIARHGLIDPILLYEDLVLDGRARLKACIAEGIHPTFAYYEGRKPVEYIRSLNLCRRHLSSQRIGRIEP